MIGFTEAIRRFYARYVDFQGRSQRSEYWWFMLYFYAVIVALSVVGLLLGADFESAQLSGVTLILVVALGLWVLGHVIGMIALAVRRFHDLGQTGWLVLVFFLVGLIPIIGFLASAAQVIWFILPGTRGPNRFGPDPLGYEADGSDPFV